MNGKELVAVLEHQYKYHVPVGVYASDQPTQGIAFCEQCDTFWPCEYYERIVRLLRVKN